MKLTDLERWTRREKHELDMEDGRYHMTSVKGKDTGQRRERKMILLESIEVIPEKWKIVAHLFHLHLIYHDKHQ